jgi:hypothetical protein
VRESPGHSFGIGCGTCWRLAENYSTGKFYVIEMVMKIACATEKHGVGGSIPPLGTINIKYISI